MDPITLGVSAIAGIAAHSIASLLKRSILSHRAKDREIEISFPGSEKIVITVSPEMTEGEVESRVMSELPQEKQVAQLSTRL